jgi:hypothetical protein
LHAAQPGKFKPASADVPPAAPNEPGTLSDTVERLPNYTPVQPTQAPLEHEQSWGEWLGSGWDQAGHTFGAAKTLQEGDNSLGYDNALSKGYAPIVAQLGLDINENPAMFGDNRLTDRSYTRLLTGQARTRGEQEQRLVDLIRARRAKDPQAFAGVPDDPVKLRQYVLAADTKERAKANAAIASAAPGLGTTLARLGGSGAGSFEDPANIVTLPIGGEAKTLLGVIARDALINGSLAAANLPGEAQNRQQRGEAPLTFGDAATEVGGAAAGGAALGTVMHGAAKAFAATGLPQAFGRVVGNLDLANTLSYKLYSAMPEAVQRKWGAGIVTKWAHRLASGEKLEDVFSNLSNVELATLSKTVIGADRMSPEERAAAEHLTRSEEVGDSSPFEPTPTGHGAHEDNLEESLNAIINNRPPEVSPSPSSDPGVGATGVDPAPARPPAATSTADRRPLAPATGPARLPTDIYEGLKARGIPDHIARGAAAGSFAESRGATDALGPITAATHGDRAFGIGQWLGGRKDELFRRYGASPSREQQLDYLAWELKGGDHGGKSVLAAKDEVEALHRYIVDFMRPGIGPETSKDLGRGMAALGRAGEQLPESAGGGFAPSDVGPDPEVARLREEALNLDDQVIGTTERPDGTPVNTYSRRVPVSDLNVDAERFQFKAGGDQFGITDRLRGVEQVDPLALGRLTFGRIPKASCSSPTATNAPGSSSASSLKPASIVRSTSPFSGRPTA